MGKSFFWLAIIIGAFITLAGIGYIYKIWAFRKSGIFTEGSIIGFESKLNSAKAAANRKKIFAPIIVFNAQDGKQVKFISKHYFDEGEYQINQQVSIFYDAENPTQALIDDKKDNYKSPIIMLVIGLLSMLIASFYVFKS